MIGVTRSGMRMMMAPEPLTFFAALRELDRIDWGRRLFVRFCSIRLSLKDVNAVPTTVLTIAT